MKKVLIGLVVLVAILIVIVSLRPDEYRIARSATLEAPPPVVFGQVNDVHAFQAWSPWAKRDPDATVTFAGPPAGTGASFSWAGNAEVGAGRMTAVESRPNELVRYRLDFLEPFASTATADFALTPAPGGTTVTWSMAGRNGFVAKAIGLVLDMDQMIGADFEKGLADMKTIAEAQARR